MSFEQQGVERRPPPLPRLSRLRLELTRLSPLRSPVGVTLIVTYDVSRLHMLDGLCASWGGHLSAAVYTGIYDDEDRDSVAHWAGLRVADAWKRCACRASRTDRQTDGGTHDCHLGRHASQTDEVRIAAPGGWAGCDGHGSCRNSGQ
jgi:hypothetical protein